MADHDEGSLVEEAFLADPQDVDPQCLDLVDERREPPCGEIEDDLHIEGIGL